MIYQFECNEYFDLHNISAIPPGLSETVTVNLQILPSAINPRSMTLVNVDASMLPPHKTVATLKVELIKFLCFRFTFFLTFFLSALEAHLQ